MTTAAEQLGITPRMVRYKIKNLRIDYQQFFKKEQLTIGETITVCRAEGP